MSAQQRNLNCKSDCEAEEDKVAHSRNIFIPQDFLGKLYNFMKEKYLV